MGFRWVAAIALWTVFIGPVFANSQTPQSSNSREPIQIVE